MNLQMKVVIQEARVIREIRVECGREVWTGRKEREDTPFNEWDEKERWVGCLSEQTALAYG